LTKATIDQTGRDLALVLDTVAPTGPVVLAGHSMGGMTIMALARRRPELFGDRVVGVFLLATSAGGLEGNGLVHAGVLGRWVRLLRWWHLLRLWLRLLELIAPLAERFRRRGTRLGRLVTRRYLFGRDDADPALVRQVQDLLERTPWTVTAAFYSTFIEHNEEASLGTLARVPVTIIAAEFDRLTPASHAQRMARLIGPSARLVVVPGAGHSVNATRPDVVNAALLELVDAVGGRGQERHDRRADDQDVRDGARPSTNDEAQ
jgi:pimeloyl-ACP methyl ester carboxylesterase